MHSVQQISALGKSGAPSVSVEWCTGASGRLAIKGGFEVLKMKDKRRRPDKPGGERMPLRAATAILLFSQRFEFELGHLNVAVFTARLFLLLPGGL